MTDMSTHACAPVNESLVPHYDLKSETGTVVKVSPDRKHREIIATGIRFTVALGINREGDLFATDQEGATWVPNGKVKFVGSKKCVADSPGSRPGGISRAR